MDANMTNEQIYEFELAKLRAQMARDEEHYRASQAMSEKHRRNWVEVCQERDRLGVRLHEAEYVLAELDPWRLQWYWAKYLPVQPAFLSQDIIRAEAAKHPGAINLNGTGHD